MMMMKKKIMNQMNLINRLKLMNHLKKVELNSKWLYFIREKNFIVKGSQNRLVCLMFHQYIMKKPIKVIILLIIIIVIIKFFLIRKIQKSHLQTNSG